RGARGLLCLLNRGIDRDAFEVLACLFRIHARDEAGLPVRVVAAHARVELARLAGDPLGDDLGAAVDQYRHDYPLLAAATTFSAASAMLFAVMMGRPDSARILRPSSSLVPFMRTTSGTLNDTAFDAATTPSAIVSHFMMPPKMLTRIA